MENAMYVPEPKVSMAKEKLAFVIRNNRKLADACERITALLEEHPEIEDDMVLVFGITPVPPQR